MSQYLSCLCSNAYNAYTLTRSHIHASTLLHSSGASQLFSLLYVNFILIWNLSFLFLPISISLFHCALVMSFFFRLMKNIQPWIDNYMRCWFGFGAFFSNRRYDIEKRIQSAREIERDRELKNNIELAINLVLKISLHQHDDNWFIFQVTVTVTCNFTWEFSRTNITAFHSFLQVFAIVFNFSEFARISTYF